MEEEERETKGNLTENSREWGGALGGWRSFGSVQKNAKRSFGSLETQKNDFHSKEFFWVCGHSIVYMDLLSFR